MRLRQNTPPTWHQINDAADFGYKTTSSCHHIKPCEACVGTSHVGVATHTSNAHKVPTLVSKVQIAKPSAIQPQDEHNPISHKQVKNVVKFSLFSCQEFGCTFSYHNSCSKCSKLMISSNALTLRTRTFVIVSVLVMGKKQKHCNSFSMHLLTRTAYEAL